MPRLADSSSLSAIFFLACFMSQANPSNAFSSVDTLSSRKHVHRYIKQNIRDLRHNSNCLGASPRSTDIAKDEMQKAAERLQRMKSRGGGHSDEHDEYAAERQELFEELRLRPANDLKAELKSLHLKVSGRKPDLAQRLADYYIDERQRDAGTSSGRTSSSDDEIDTVPAQQMDDAPMKPLTKFGGLLDLSSAAGTALSRAHFTQPSPIQAAAIPALARGENCILHAETGSGKTLTYLLPITEMLWKEADLGRTDPLAGDTKGFAIILTPTRELAAQVAGVATVLAPPGTVRLISQPTNLLREGNANKERGEDEFGGRKSDVDTSSYGKAQPRILVGSAKAIMTSLFGNSKMPAPPTSKPEAKKFLENVGYVVMDEVDRLLNVKKSRSEKAYKKHEKPAAVLTSAVARYTLGKAQMVAASATVGRPLRRELSRVLGLPTQECPPVIRGKSADGDDDGEDDSNADSSGTKNSRFGDITGRGAANSPTNAPQLGRVVTIPPAVTNYVVPSMGDSSGQLLTTAASIVKNLPLRKLSNGSERPRRVLLVLSKGCELSVRNAMGALQHFQCQPEPRALIDVLEADGTDRMIEVHRRVSGATGVGQSLTADASEFADGGDENNTNDEGYLYVTGEDSVRGLHLDNLDTVICVGRPRGPDEYTHIAGRTGRAGNKGTVINVVSYEQATALTSWEKMLDVNFYPLEEDEVSELSD